MTGCPILGVRGSPLALAMAAKAAAALEGANRWAVGGVRIVTITTSGDRIQDRPLADIGGKALWTKELDRALLVGETDFSIHSLKDVESVRPDSIRLAAVLPRADAHDRLVGADSIAGLKPGARVGTSSPRRKAQLLSLRPDLEIVPLRGNVDTRLAKLAAGDMDAMVLAAAGLDRLGKGATGTAIPIEQMLPAPGQAVIAMECRSDDKDLMRALTTVDDAETHAAILAERAFTAALGATCHSPVAALAMTDQGAIHLRAILFAEDGSESLAEEARFEIGDLDSARALATAMLAQASPAIRRLFS